MHSETTALPTRSPHNDIIVLKFGSSVLRTRADLPTAVHEIYRWYRAGNRVLVVVSAIGDATDLLLASARATADGTPDPHATAELLATGERASAALLGIALDRAGIPARVVDPRDVQLSLVGDPLDSEPVSVNAARLHFLLRDTPVIVMPGFFGHDNAGRLTLLGRGGTDLTAVFLAHALEATRCRLIKDVDGVYDADPHTSATAKRLATLSYDDTLARAAPFIQPKAVQFLKRHNATAEVAALACAYESVIAPRFAERAAHDAQCQPAPPPRRTRVALMGLGIVGFGVYQRLIAMKHDFEVTAILIRNRARYAARHVSENLLHTSVDSFLRHVAGTSAAGTSAASGVRAADVVIDALPGLEPSNHLTAAFLAAGIAVVSANKSMVATAGPRLAILATRTANLSAFLYAAAVGGSAPMIEAVRRAPVKAITGILNGTCNYLLNRAAEPASAATLHDAVRDAQQLGLAEADPGEDLSGRDSARKLRVLIRHAFGRDVDPDRIDLEAIDVTTFPRARQARAAGKVLRHIATARLNTDHGSSPGNGTSGPRLTAHVRLTALDPTHPLADVPGEWNRLLIHHTDGTQTIVTGRGAGRWPTTEAVIADLLDFRMNASART